MRLSKYIDRRPTRRRTTREASKVNARGIATHSAFIPMVTAWGASLLGLSVAVLPVDAISRITMLTKTDFLGFAAMPVYAATAALLGGGIAYIVAASLREWAFRRGNASPVASAMGSRIVRPIDPVTELGSESLDAPIEEAPFAAADEEGEFVELREADVSEKPEPTLGELAKRGYDIETPEDCSASEDADDTAFTRKHFRAALIETCEAAGSDAEEIETEAEVVAEFEVATDTLPDAPRALDLGEFAELPGRNAVWVEEEVAVEEAVPAEEPTPPVEKAQPVPASALERLRQKNPEDLSLVEMVERFAGALHEHQQAEAARPKPNPPHRDAALAEALKALTLFTKDGFDQPARESEESQLSDTERELRSALTKLRSLSGAA